MKLLHSDVASAPSVQAHATRAHACVCRRTKRGSLQSARARSTFAAAQLGAHALDAQDFAANAACTARQPRCAHAVRQVLLEVAASVQHLHNMQLLHCDIKPENVLLKSDSANPLGFTTKLSDFGLAKLLRDNYYIINRSGSGTVTHLAPELFQVCVSSAVRGKQCCA